MKTKFNSLPKFLFLFLIFCSQSISGQILPVPIVQLSNGYIAPSYSPDGHYILCSQTGYDGLYLFNLTKREVDRISSEKGSGYGYCWSSSSDKIAYKSFDRVANLPKIWLYTLPDKRIIEIPKEIKKGSLRFTTGNDGLYNPSIGPVSHVKISSQDTVEEYVYSIVNNQIQKIGLHDGNRTTVFTSEKQLLNIDVSPDMELIAIEEYGGDLLIHEIATNNTINLGEGNKPHFSPDGEKVVFMRTKDDGHQLTESDIFIAQIDGASIRNLTKDFDALAMRPTWHPDGHSIIFDTDGFGPIFTVSINK